MSVGLDARIEDAYAANFRASALVTIVCISLCECGIGSASGCETGCNPDSGSESCGVLQIFQPAHPGTAVCASNPPCCFTLGWQISNGGTDFHPWTTFQNGCWSGHIAEVTAAINALPPPIGPPSPAPTPVPHPTPTPTPTPTGPPAAAPGLSDLVPLLLAAGGVGLAWYELRRNPSLRRRVSDLTHAGGGFSPTGSARTRLAR